MGQNAYIFLSGNRIFLCTRILVCDRKQIVLTPIEVSIEDIQLKVAKLDAAIKVIKPTSCRLGSTQRTFVTFTDYRDSFSRCLIGMIRIVIVKG